jgi:hypothetical protein
MIKKQQITPQNRLYSLFMLLMLAWLTVCLPFVAESNESIRAQIELTGEEAPDLDNNNPLSSTNEEKSENGTSLLSEYLPHTAMQEHRFTAVVCFYKCHPSGLYVAYHPERIIPPPEV